VAPRTDSDRAVSLPNQGSLAPIKIYLIFPIDIRPDMVEDSVRRCNGTRRSASGFATPADPDQPGWQTGHGAEGDRQAALRPRQRQAGGVRDPAVPEPTPQEPAPGAAHASRVRHAEPHPSARRQVVLIPRGRAACTPPFCLPNPPPSPSKRLLESFQQLMGPVRCRAVPVPPNPGPVRPRGGRVSRVAGRVLRHVRPVP
jgi:hypothetical protein